MKRSSLIKAHSAGIIILFFFLGFHRDLKAQQLQLFPNYQGAKVLSDNGDTLSNPFAGGMLNPQFGNIDLNGDGVQDLVSFEPVDGCVSAFLNLHNGEYRYVPEYESSFPSMKGFMILADYNKDGKADIFTYSLDGGGLAVYQNTSAKGELGFRKVSSLLLYEDIGYKLNLYVANTDIPAVTDIDGDGDLDIVALDVFQSYAEYYRNMSMERYGKPDSLAYRIEDRCWGKFIKSYTDNSVVLGSSCARVVHKKGKQHGGTNLCAIDIDGDGDQDILTGDPQYADLFLLVNGRRTGQNPNNFPVDSMTSVEKIFPSVGRQASIEVYPAAFPVQIGNDPLPGLIISPQGQYTSQTTHQVLYYRNSGTSSKPVYSFVQDDLLQNQMIDGGAHAAPALWDFDADSLPDLVIATQGNNLSSYEFDKLVLYKNIGTRSQAVFKKISNDFTGLAARKYSYIMPCFGDLDGDGLADMLLGRMDGGISYYHNKGLNGQMPQMEFVTDTFSGIDIGSNSAPFLADLDHDGKLDLFIGRQAGSIAYYHNDGTNTQPRFTLVTDTFGNVHTNAPYYEYIYNDSGRVIRTILRHEPTGYAVPLLTDLNGNSDWDLITGSLKGQASFYMDVEKQGDTFRPAANVLHNAKTALPEERNTGVLTAPAAGTIGHNGKMALLIGNYKGGLYFYAADRMVYNGLTPQPHAFNFKVFPNPAKEEIYIELPGCQSVAGGMNLQLMNAEGRTIIQMLIQEDEKMLKLPVGKILPGLYFVVITNAAGERAVQKLVR